MNKYQELKEKHQKEVNEFPFMFAFNQKQFDEGMKKLGLEPGDTDKIYNLGTGAYIRKTDKDAYREMLTRHAEDYTRAIESDSTGEGFIFDMFYYELNNHEYSYTGYLDDTLDALGYTYEEIKENKALTNGLNKAIKTITND